MEEKEEEKKEMVSAPTEQATNENGATTPAHNMGEDPIAQRLAQKKQLQPLTQKNATQGQSQVSTQTPQQEDEWSAIETGREALQKNLDKEIENVRKSQDEERVKEAKKQRNRQIINSIADGISAIANLGGTIYGAPDMSANSTLTGKSAERYNKMYKDAEERRKNYLKIVQDQGDESIKNWYTMQKDKIATKQKQQEIEIKEKSEIRAQAKMEFDQAIERAKDERDKAKHDIEMEILDLKAKGLYTDNKIKEYEQKIIQVESKYAESKAQAELAYKNALTKKTQADTYASLQRGKYYQRSGGSSSSSKENYILAVTDKNGVRTSEKIYPWDSRYKQLSIQLDESDGNNNNGGSRISLTNLITHDEGEKTMPGVNK